MTICQFNYSQTAGDYRTKQSGSWDAASTWEVFNGTMWIIATQSPGTTEAQSIIPTYKVTIRSPHTITYQTYCFTQNIKLEYGANIDFYGGYLIYYNLAGIDFLVDGTINFKGTGQLGSSLFPAEMTIGEFGIIDASLATGDIRGNIVNNGIIKGDIRATSVNLINNNKLILKTNGGFILENSASFINYGVIELNSGFNEFINQQSNFINNGEIKIISGNLKFVSFFTTNNNFENNGKFIGNGIIDIANTITYTNNAKINPGQSPGQLEINGLQPLSPTSTLNIEILNNSGAGIGHDQLKRTGDITLNGILNVTELGQNVPTGNYVIVSATGNISGDFTQTNLPQGYTIFTTAHEVIITKPVTVSSGVAAASALKLDGYNDYLSVPNPNLGISNAITVEAWIKPSSLTFGTVFNPSNNSSNDIPKTIIQHGARLGLYGYFPGYSLKLMKLGTQYAYVWYIYDGNGYNSIGNVSYLSGDFNKWIHIAGTYNGQTAKLFINGVQVASDTRPSPLLNLDLTGQQLHISHAITAQTASTQGYSQPWDGSIDELKIWNRTLTETEIRERMCKKIQATDPLFSSLKLYYNFDENTGSTAIDQSSHNNNASFNQFTAGFGINILSPLPDEPLGPSWITSCAAVADNAAFSYTGSSSTANLTNTRGDNLNISLTTGSATGLQIYNVDEPPTVTTGIGGQLPNSNYFGVVVDNPSGNPLTYTATFNYGGIAGITDETQLRLYRRDNPADPTWEDSGATLDPIANTLTVTGTNTEYILGLASTPLPVTLISFTGKKVQQGVLLKWKTANEKAFSHFEVERSPLTLGGGITSEKFIKIGIKAGNASENYEFLDSTPPLGAGGLYRLKMVDLDGSASYSKIISVDTRENKYYFKTENPATAGQILVNTNYKNPEFTLINAVGQRAAITIHKVSDTEYSITPQKPGGMYYLMLSSENEVVTRKLILK